MAHITLDVEKLKFNFEYLDCMFAKKHIDWSIVTKILCGNKLFLKELLTFTCKSVCDSRILNLKMIKSIHPEIETIFIKPPSKWNIKGVINYADISLNTDIDTIMLLSQEAKRQNKTHKIIIMVELGELREGIMRDDLIKFYSDVFNLENIDVIGIGANLSCLYGILPSHDKLIQLSLYTQLIEAKFNRKIPFISGGTSVTIPLIFSKQLPKGINHFRVGETLFFGTDVYNGRPFKQMKNDVFTLYAEIIELIVKPSIPIGEMGTNMDGQEMQFEQQTVVKTSHRAIVDIGLLDIDMKHLFPVDKSLEIVGGSSDMLVVDLKDNPKNYSSHDLLEFTMDYMGVLRVLNSKYIDKRIVHNC